MCVYSMIGDHYTNKWKPMEQPGSLGNPFSQYVSQITREEFDALKKEVLEMKALLKKAQEYDKKHNEPDCETETKIRLLKAMAKAVGVDLSDITEKK